MRLFLSASIKKRRRKKFKKNVLKRYKRGKIKKNFLKHDKIVHHAARAHVLLMFINILVTSARPIISITVAM